MDRGSQLSKDDEDDEDDEDDKDDKDDKEDEEEEERRTRQEEAEEEEQEEEEEATDIKSNNPHLAGGKTSKMGLCLEVLQALCPSGAAVMRWIYIFIFVVNKDK